ncbi:MAG TPA: chromate efflux transporter [Acidimicrobiales bacterium]|nr:chromate efflux transporter [Acidimicrobiales bacterium]
MPDQNDAGEGSRRAEVALSTICREWTRIGCIGFGGPPTHIALLRRLCVEQRHWLEPGEFEDGVAATNLLPGPASTQMAIFCARQLRGWVGGLLGGLCFIVPGLLVVLALSAVFLTKRPPMWIVGAAAGAGAAVPAIALHAASGFVPASWSRVGGRPSEKGRWLLYVLGGAAAASVLGSYLVLVLLAAGLAETAIRQAGGRRRSHFPMAVPVALGHTVAFAGFGALALVAFKVGALSYGGGFVIVPLMQHDAVSTFHFLTGQQFLSAVVLGQVTPGPVVHTVAAVGYGAGGVGGGLFAAVVAFSPSFVFVLTGARHFDRLRSNLAVQAFLTGAGAAVIGAIAGSAVPLGRTFGHLWQVPLLVGALLWLFVVRRGVVSALLTAGLVGVVLALTGVSV